MATRGDSGALACMINAEVGTVLAVMRRNARWAGSYLADDDQWEHSLVHSLKSLRRKIFSWHQPWHDINPNLYLQPFLDVIRSDETSAPITGVALTAIYNILSFEVFNLGTAHVATAMHSLVEAVTSCRFEVVDPASEEVVLMKILQVLHAVMKHEASKVLNDKDLCHVVNTCFRVVQQAVTKGELLQRSARQIMHDIVKVIFARLPHIAPSQKQSDTCSATDANNDVDSGATVNMETHAYANGSSKNNLEASANSSSTHSADEASTGGDGEMKDPEKKTHVPTEPYGIIGIVDIFRNLCSLLDSGIAVGQNLRAMDEDIPLFALGLINSAIELGGSSFANHVELLTIIQDELFQCIIQLALLSKNPLILSLACSVVLNLYHHLRCHLKLQLESFFSCVILRLAQGKYGATYQQQEVAMEALVDFCRQPSFMAEMYVNFDCDISCGSLFEELGGLLSKTAFPVNCPLSAMHVLSLEGLIAVIQGMVERMNSMQNVPQPVIDPPTADCTPFWAAKCDSYTDPNCWVEFVQKQKFIKHKLMIGADHFNRDPKKGLEFLQGIHLLPEKLEPQSVACFFRYTIGLDKNLVGDFLGNHDEFALQVLDEFTKTFDFKETSLDTALRIFLSTFRLPGEAQKIHRVLEAFAERYYQQSPHVLADKDAAFLLAYSLIILNTDQHNSQVKKKMTEEDFIRNNRKINGGQDLPREYLSNLYHSIVRNEIKMSYENGGVSEMTPNTWFGVIHKSKNASPYIVCDSRPFLDQNMFNIVSGPTVAAISVVFDHAEDEEVLKLCEEGFLAVAKASSTYHLVEVLDDLVVSLCNFTTLLNPAGSLEDPLISFSEDTKARLSLQTVFNIANNYGDHIRSSWRNIVDCILQLQKMGLLSARILSDATDENDTSTDIPGKSMLVGTITVTVPPVGIKKRPSGIMGRFSQLLYLEADEPNVQPTEEQVAAHQRALRIVEACHIDSLISESKFLQAESLLQLAKSLLRMSGRPSKAGASSEDEDTAVFCLDLLISIVLHNRDRILLLWHIVYEHISNIVQTTIVPSPLVEKAVFGLLRICQRLLPYKEELAEELLRSLQVILKLDACIADILCERITQEVMQLVKTNARHIQSQVGWRTVSSLLSITARHLEASEIGFEALSFVMLDCAHLTRANYVLFLDAARAFAEAPTGGVDRSLRALDLMADSVKCLVKWSSTTEESSTTSESKETGSTSQDLGEMWLKLVLSHKKLVNEPREDVRNHALLCLQRCLSAAENMHPPVTTVGQVFDQVVFVMLDDLLEIATKRSPKEFRNMENTLYLAMKLASKTFLQFLDQLAALPNFPSMWSALLNHMERYMKTKLRGKSSDKLEESIPELLKNMLLVMKTQGVLVQGSTLDGYTLWELTWHYVQGIAPSLQSELFPKDSVKPEESHPVETPVSEN